MLDGIIAVAINIEHAMKTFSRSSQQMKAGFSLVTTSVMMDGSLLTRDTR